MKKLKLDLRLGTWELISVCVGHMKQPKFLLEITWSLKAAYDAGKFKLRSSQTKDYPLEI